MGEGTVFSLFVSPHLGGYPSQVWGEGVPHPSSGWGDTQGTPRPGQDGVPPGPGMGYHPPEPGTGYPPDQGWGIPLDLGWGTPQTWDRVPPGPVPPGQGIPSRPGMGYPHPPPPELGHNEHLLRGGRYASCVHAGGLSCLI